MKLLHKKAIAHIHVIFYPGSMCKLTTCRASFLCAIMRMGDVNDDQDEFIIRFPVTFIHMAFTFLLT